MEQLKGVKVKQIGFGMLKYNPRFNQLFSCPFSTYAFEAWPLVPGEKNLRILRFKDEMRTHDFIINGFKDNEVTFENNTSQACVLKFESKEHLINFFLEINERQPFYSDYDRDGQSYNAKGKLYKDELRKKLEDLLK